MPISYESDKQIRKIFTFSFLSAKTPAFSHGIVPKPGKKRPAGRKGRGLKAKSQGYMKLTQYISSWETRYRTFLAEPVSNLAYLEVEAILSCFPDFPTTKMS